MHEENQDAKRTDGGTSILENPEEKFLLSRCWARTNSTAVALRRSRFAESLVGKSLIPWEFGIDYHITSDSTPMRLRPHDLLLPVSCRCGPFQHEVHFCALANSYGPGC
jgi:hypothetical protein